MAISEAVRIKTDTPTLPITHREISKQTLIDQFGGTVNSESGIWNLKNLNVFISPLDREAAKYSKCWSRELGSDAAQTSVIFYNDEWCNKTETVLSMIGSRLGLTANKIWARDTDVVVLTDKEAKSFFDRNHISGGVQSVMSVGLKLGNEIISAISFRTPFVKKYSGMLEVSRFASKTDTSIPGAFGKLMAHSIDQIKDGEYSSVLTYADLRYGTGAVYAKNGFELIGKTGLDYYYTDGIRRYNRFKFRAQNGMSEADYAASKGVYKIYGCGSAIYQMKI